MSLKARLKKLEKNWSGGDKPLFIVMQYAEETEADARAAYPELPLPSCIQDASVVYVPRLGTRPVKRPHEDRPGYHAEGLRAVLHGIDGKTCKKMPSGTFPEWRRACELGA